MPTYFFNPNWTFISNFIPYLGHFMNNFHEYNYLLNISVVLSIYDIVFCSYP